MENKERIQGSGNVSKSSLLPAGQRKYGQYRKAYT